jgi:drug/metabolite transporter (DMT)-like permease
MILTTLAMILMRRLRSINHTIITISFASWGAVAAIIMCLYQGVFILPTEIHHVLLLVASGATSFLGQTFLTLGLKYESAGVVALLANFVVIFSFLFEFIFLHVAPDVYR